MDDLHKWLEGELAEHRTEPNSGLGHAIRYCCGTDSVSAPGRGTIG